MINKSTHIAFILSLLACIGSTANAQVRDSLLLTDEGADKVHLIAKVADSKDRILLRWGPGDPITWLYANRYGYTVEKYTVVRNKELVVSPQKEILTPNGLRPDPVEYWEDFVDENDFGAVAAQAIYGEGFEVSQNNAGDIMQVINKSTELEQRFSFALYAADQSREVAKRSGLFYEDTSVRIDDKYLYKVYANVPVEVSQIDTAFYYIGLDDHIPLPMPTGVQVAFADHTAMVSWESFHHVPFYNSYLVEKSEDGKSFVAIDDLAGINTTKDGSNSRKSYRMDSLAYNDKPYYYRIRGVSSFGEVGPPSEVVEGMGKSTLKVKIGITSANVDSQQTVTLNWEAMSDQMDLIKGFEIERSNNANGPYEVINANLIDNAIRTFNDPKPMSTNYYRVVAMSKYNDRKNSFSKMVQLQDSIPPAVPIMLTGHVDSLGVVNISWQPNKEGDLLGYRVYRSNFKNSEFGQVTKEPIFEASFIDTIQVKTLTSAIYYKVMAVDHRFNPSSLSEAIGLKRPDVIPPVSPVFKSIKSVDEGIAIQWVNSSSTDVAMHILYKNKNGEADWNLTRSFPTDTLTRFVDQEVDAGVYYNYTMVAIDSAKLQSLPAKAVQGIKVDTGIRHEIQEAKAIVDRTNKSITIQWEYDQELVKGFEIYKKQQEESLSLYTTLSSNEEQFVDTNLIVNTSYMYRVKAIYVDGSESPFSKEIKVKY